MVRFVFWDFRKFRPLFPGFSDVTLVFQGFLRVTIGLVSRIFQGSGQFFSRFSEVHTGVFQWFSEGQTLFQGFQGTDMFFCGFTEDKTFSTVFRIFRIFREPDTFFEISISYLALPEDYPR